MELGLMLEPQVGGTYRELADLARWAEQEGLDAFARSDHYLAGDGSAAATDALTTFGGLAMETERIELVSLVSPLTFRHPAVLAKTGATLDEMSGGRFALGIGTGWMETEHEAFGMELYGMRERFSRLFETLSYVRAAYAGTDGFSGRHYHLASGVDILPRPVNGRIVVGGQGPKKTPTMAGRFADEYNVFAIDPAGIEQRLEVMREAARAAERDPEDILLSISSSAVVADTEDGYRALLATRASLRGMPVDEYEALLASRNIPRGTLDTVSEAVDRFADVGAERFYLQVVAPLSAIDPAEIGPIFNALRG
jgi:alkanesulfonate monooxygenase SsuD/methylene tetrahydromethanopterin reductase-like flavin-dependent oxidoreductase (luciferase family)